MYNDDDDPVSGGGGNEAAEAEAQKAEEAEQPVLPMLVVVGHDGFGFEIEVDAAEAQRRQASAAATELQTGLQLSRSNGRSNSIDGDGGGNGDGGGTGPLTPPAVSGLAKKKGNIPSPHGSPGLHRKTLVPGKEPMPTSHADPKDKGFRFGISDENRSDWLALLHAHNTQHGSKVWEVPDDLNAVHKVRSAYPYRLRCRCPSVGRMSSTRDGDGAGV